MIGCIARRVTPEPESNRNDTTHDGNVCNVENWPELEIDEVDDLATQNAIVSSGHSIPEIADGASGYHWEDIPEDPIRGRHRQVDQIDRHDGCDDTENRASSGETAECCAGIE